MHADNILVVTRYGSDKAMEIAIGVVDILKDILGAKIYTVRPSHIEGVMSIDEGDVKIMNFDLAVTIGGDGTVLRASRWLSNPTPIFAVKLPSSKGMLAEVTSEEVYSTLPRLAEDSYYIERRMRLLTRVDGDSLQPSLNEVFIVRDTLTKTPTYSISMLNSELSYRMDGIIVATPTGSTGHSFSLNGPIVYESMQAIILTPVAPITKSPSLVMPSDTTVTIRCSTDTNVVIDGQVVHRVKQGSSIEVSRYEHDAVFLRFNRRGLRQIRNV
jgi:NAD+ kinase